MQRILGRYEGKKDGPLVLAIGAMHGNEPAGVAAIREVFNMLEKEPDSNPDFVFYGQMVGLVGNLVAFGQNQRYIANDLNRLWKPKFVEGILNGSIPKTIPEHWELEGLARAIQTEINRYGAQKTIILDLHTTSAGGGIFTIPLESDPVSIRLSSELHAPVVLGLLAGLEGTFMHYAHHPKSHLHQTGSAIHTLAFEAGQHNDPLSVNRAISATIGLLRGAGCVHHRDVGNHHDAILQEYAQKLPKMTRITHVHHIQPDEAFVMRPGYINFQSIEKEEYLADNRFGPVHAPHRGHILMPLYQPQGVDGYFLVEEI
jgi:succinylglutamate desuccinylase